MSKTGLIVEGGGMKCAYSAGILDAFLDQNVHFDYCIGVSAGSGNLASFQAKQRGRNLRYYTVHTKNPDFFGIKSWLKNGNLFNLPYIYGNMTNEGGADPLDYDALMADPAELIFTATDARTGRPVYFPKRMMKRNQYAPLMASNAIPAACRPVKVRGRYYYDGGVSDSIPVRRALRDKCDRLVILLSNPRHFVKKPEKMKVLYTLLCHRYPAIIRDLNHRHIDYNKTRQVVFKLEKLGKAMIFAPETLFKETAFTMNPETQKKLYDMGFSEGMKRQKELDSFLNQPPV